MSAVAMADSQTHTHSHSIKTEEYLTLLPTSISMYCVNRIGLEEKWTVFNNLPQTLIGYRLEEWIVMEGA